MLCDLWNNCIHYTEEQARELLFAAGLGSLVSLGLVILMFAAVFLHHWSTRNRAMDTIDAILSGKPTKSKHYISIRSPFY
jgi:CRISPR/Cas system-associated endonuclease Cas3-HD